MTPEEVAALEMEFDSSGRKVIGYKKDLEWGRRFTEDQVAAILTETEKQLQ